MLNIWDFIFITLDVSTAALFILIIKRLLLDKLSPRWQYGIWGAFALKAILPVSINHSFFPFPIFIEAMKGMCESRLNSAYCNLYSSPGIRFSIPFITAQPKSLTDFLFIVYVIGIALSFLHYMISYIRLRVILKKGASVSEETQIIIDGVCKKYKLKNCHAVQVNGISSAFVCGVIRPVLALPNGEAPDEKVLLHELLHLKHCDALQSILWCVLKSIHWCNPFILYVFSRINNDMESLCDQRVLELLDGEERREYGAILLEMANDKYAHAVGTTSISNGGKNISRRIESIVRFKKYPKGMALVSVCIAVIIACPLIFGTAQAAIADDYSSENLSSLAADMTFSAENEGFEMSGYNTQRAIALSRSVRCETLAGAVDTYAKGVMLDNVIYQAIASPERCREKLFSSIISKEFHNPLEGFYNKQKAYRLYNLDEAEGGEYCGVLALPLNCIVDENGESPIDLDAAFDEHTYYDINGNRYAPDDPSEGWFMVVPISIKNENGWTVRETAKRQLTYLGDEKCFDGVVAENVIAPIRTDKIETENGKLTVKSYTIMSVNNTEGGGDYYFDEYMGLVQDNAAVSYPTNVWSCSMNSILKTDALFYVRESFKICTFEIDEASALGKKDVGHHVAWVDSADDEADYTEYLNNYKQNGNISLSSSDSEQFTIIPFSDFNERNEELGDDYRYDEFIKFENGKFIYRFIYSDYKIFNGGEKTEELTEFQKRNYKIRLFLNGEMTDEAYETGA